MEEKDCIVHCVRIANEGVENKKRSRVFGSRGWIL
jgi:hypothetical protein